MSAAKTLSINNQYHIPKYRYLELKNYCRQYDDWKKEYTMRSAGLKSSKIDISPVNRAAIIRGLEEQVIDSSYYLSLMLSIDSCAIEACANSRPMRDLIFYGVTKGLSYDVLVTRDPGLGVIPRNLYYEAYRKFFYILDRYRKEQHNG